MGETELAWNAASILPMLRLARVKPEGMKTVGVFYATREGHTQRIAEHVAADLRVRGIEPKVENLRSPSTTIHLSDYAGVILAASVHIGEHESEMVNFVKQHRSELEAMPTAFLSVTLSEAGAERPGTTPEGHARFAADVAKVVHAFFEETGWQPQFVKPVAGALLYTQYNILVRLVMKQIARKTGASTDTSHDHEYTDWDALDRFVEEFAQALPHDLPGSVSVSKLAAAKIKIEGVSAEGPMPADRLRA